MGSSIARIHRDVRFSMDKSPYTTSLTLRFGHTGGQPALGYFLRVGAERVVVGAGIRQHETPALARIRAHRAAHPARWQVARDAVVEAIGPLGGESPSRPPKGVVGRRRAWTRITRSSKT